MGFALHVALRYLRSRRGFVSVVTGFSLGGIALGVAALIVVMSVMNGFRAELLGKILGTTGHALVTAPDLTTARGNRLRTELMTIDGVEKAVPFIGGQAMVVSHRRALGGLVRGLYPVDLRAQTLLADNIVDGSLDGFGMVNGAVMGAEMAESLGVGVGDWVQLLSPEGSQTIMGFIPRMMRVQVIALFDVGMYQYDSALMYLPFEQAQTFYRFTPLISGIDITVTNPDRIQEYTPKLSAVVGDMAVVKDWRTTNQQFFSALQVEKLAMFIILTMIVLVAALNIITGQMMTVNEKKKDIAILRTMGATRGDIVRTFFLGGALVGLGGTLLGFLLGLLIVFNLQPIVSFFEQVTGAEVFSNQVYFLSRLPARLVPVDIAVIVGMSVALSLLASLFPAWRAARLDPVEGLRNA